MSVEEYNVKSEMTPSLNIAAEGNGLIRKLYTEWVKNTLSRFYCTAFYTC